MNKICSYIYNYYVKHGVGRFSYIYRYLFRKNPIIVAKVNEQSMLLPFNHMLPFYQSKYQNYDCQLRKICETVWKRIGELRVIDVGANVGDTIINIGNLGGGIFGY